MVIEKLRRGTRSISEQNKANFSQRERSEVPTRMISTPNICSVLLLILILSVGCTEPRGDRGIGFDTDQVVNETHGGYVFNSTLFGSARRIEEKTYQNVSILFYSKDRDKIASVEVGLFSTTDTVTIREHLNQRPYYVIIWSSDFWSDSKLKVYGLQRGKNGTYTSYRV